MLTASFPVSIELAGNLRHVVTDMVRTPGDEVTDGGEKLQVLKQMS